MPPMPIRSDVSIGSPPPLFHSRTIMKRLFALGGVWLTFAAGLQQSGSLCQLIHCGCDATASRVVADVHADCLHRHEDHEHHAAHRQSDHHDDAAGRTDGPCQRDCWCCQPPAPQQQPTSLDADALTQPAATGAATATLAVDASAPSLHATNNASASERAVDVCARLCRFLV